MKENKLTLTLESCFIEKRNIISGKGEGVNKVFRSKYSTVYSSTFKDIHLGFATAKPLGQKYKEKD